MAQSDICTQPPSTRTSRVVLDDPSADWESVIGARADMSPAHVACDACPECADVCRDITCDVCSRKQTVQAEGKYTKCQVRRHCTQSSCWLISHGKIYDATQYLSSHGHPGGERAILRRAGGESSEDHDFHGKSGQKVWRSMKIGHVERCPSEAPDDRCIIQ
jgi:cytochrome b involved in lipid metabolism